jgi:hypothetical protein
MVFVDSNVILDVINPIVYAEIAFLAARAHAEYRARPSP